MADEAPRKRSFRKYSYRGVDLEQLLDMSTDELVELFGARQRRRCVLNQQNNFDFGLAADYLYFLLGPRVC